MRKAHAWFSHGALLDPVNPGLTLQKNGTVGLPLSVHGARRIFEEYLVDGKGSTYKIDAADFACRLEAEQFDLKNPSWAKYIDGVWQQVVKGLSIRNARMELQGLSFVLRYSDSAGARKITLLHVSYNARLRDSS